MTLLDLLAWFFAPRRLLDRVRERSGSDLSDAELGDMIAAIEQELDVRFGLPGARTIELGDATDPDLRWQRTLRLPQPADASKGLTIVEINPGNSADSTAERELTVADWRLMHGGRTLQRTVSGTNPSSYWAPLVRVTFTPIGSTTARDEVTIKLMLIDLAYRGGLRSERAGDYSVTLSGDHAADREAVMRALELRRGMVFA